jgi:hypothetical protein
MTMAAENMSAIAVPLSTECVIAPARFCSGVCVGCRMSADWRRTAMPATFSSYAPVSAGSTSG